MTSKTTIAVSARRARSSYRAFRVSASTLALVLVALPSIMNADERRVNLSRSIYVPVEFIACPHVKNITLSVLGESAVFAPGKRTFLFTLYHDRDELLPESVDVRIAGDGMCNGRPFETNVLVTPEAIHSGSGSRAFDLEPLRKKLRVHRDAHLPLRRILITCDHQCETAETELNTPGGETLSGDGTAAAGSSGPNGGSR